ncbi:histidine kinase [Lysinibacillus sp. 2017]|uniref:ATP-binding protein n=1 Tax=unclassified Lysinibacillus TaxID=2636778 RepID=UPI000D528594|nr:MULTISPECIES: ATP-binding protein [unclassified Lysinibacillus]AWE06890.1 histidine kinase [Lysinibacillus sp. 2017]TGN37179.1 HAMP domain-containing protein [Lysinibacillus sp. S2017]
MIRIATSIVGKLWVTILLLVSFVLFIFTIFMLEFLEKYHNEQTEESLRQTAAVIATIVDDEALDEKKFAIISELLSETTNALVAKNSNEVIFADQQGVNEKPIQQKIISNKSFEKVYETEKPIVKELLLPSNKDPDRMNSYIVLGFPLKSEDATHGAVFIYKNPDAIHEASKQTTKIVVFAAAIAIVLTTIFAFFLSSKITSPLRKMREHAFELAKGRFDAKLDTKQNDEIGQLAVAFNQMGRQLKHHLEVINQEKEQLSSILTSMTDAVITFNRDKTILLSNPPAERLLQKWFVEKGLDSSKPIPVELYEMLDHVLSFEDQIDEELALGKSYYSITISPLYSGDAIRGAIAVIRDKTEETKLEKLKSDFIANVSHELRTPIAMLQGYSEAIIDGIVTTEEDRNDMIRVIYDESQRMGRLVTDLLDLARMESGHMRLYKDDVPLVSVIERMTHKFDQAAKEKHVTLYFETKIPPELLIPIDEDRIEQVLTNLIDNAIRHTSTEGSVTVSVVSEQNFAKIQVSDTGQGIPKDDLPYVFERFYKADKARTRSKGGTGLGLAITKNIVEAHNGSISVDSIEQQGTTFTFYLPLA